MAPSPTSATTGRSGWANLAPIAYGTAAPMVARVPDSEPRIVPRIRRWRAYHVAAQPEVPGGPVSRGPGVVRDNRVVRDAGGQLGHDPHGVDRVGVHHRLPV